MSDTPRVPRPLVAACLVLLLEAAAVAGMAVTFVVDIVRGAAVAAGATAVMTVFFLGLAALLVLAARALVRGQRWGRGPAITWQLLQGATALATAGGSPPPLTTGMLVAAAVAVTGIVWPTSREHLTGTAVPPGVA